MEHRSYHSHPEASDDMVTESRPERLSPHQKRLERVGELLDRAGWSGWLSTHRLAFLRNSLHAVETGEPERYRIATEVVAERLQRLSNPMLANVLQARQTELSHALSFSRDLLAVIEERLRIAPPVYLEHRIVRKGLEGAAQLVLRELLAEIMPPDDADVLTTILEEEYRAELSRSSAELARSNDPSSHLPEKD